MIRSRLAKTMIVLTTVCGMAAIALALAVAVSQDTGAERSFGLILSVSIVFSVLYLRYKPTNSLVVEQVR